ncbi:SRPBCC domain-containing protein [Nonomuraea sp. NPDC049421]|uniref:SRPBCC family protein n=1 Tax=Nonomuraea sp. NPDC049421 TaxID=3155275 RepID=UPI003439350B
MSMTVAYDLVHLLGAPRPLVWAAWTEPERFCRWFGPAWMATPLGRVTLDVRAGGAWGVTLVGDEGFEMVVGGRYREVVAPERLVFTTGAGDRAASVVTVVFVAAGAGTELRVREIGVGVGREGWEEFCGRLAAYLEP